MCPSFVGGVSAGRFLEAGLLGPGCEQRVPDGYRWPVCPEPYFMPVWHMGSAPSELLIFADLRFWVSLNTLSVGKNFFCIFFCIFSVKCLFISFTNFSFFLGFLSLGLSVVYMLGQVTLCCRYFSQFVSCLLSYKCFWPCGLFYFNCCASLSVVVFAPGFWSTCPEVKESLTPVFCYLLLSFIYLRLCSIWGLLQYVWCNLWISFCLLPNGHSFIPGPVIEKSIFAPWLETESRSSLGPLMHLFFPSCRLQACGAEVMPTHPTVPRARPAGLEASSLQGVLWGQVPRPGWDSGLPWWLFLRLCRIIAVPDSVSCNTVLSVSVWAPVTSTWPSVLTCGPTAPSPSTMGACRLSSTSPSSTAWESRGGSWTRWDCPLAGGGPRRGPDFLLSPAGVGSRGLLPSEAFADRSEIQWWDQFAMLVPGILSLVPESTNCIWVLILTVNHQ